jgi:hypothetical protein
LSPSQTTVGSLLKAPQQLAPFFILPNKKINKKIFFPHFLIFKNQHATARLTTPD